MIPLCKKYYDLFGPLPEWGGYFYSFDHTVEYSVVKTQVIINEPDMYGVEISPNEKDK